MEISKLRQLLELLMEYSVHTYDDGSVKLELGPGGHKQEEPPSVGDPGQREIPEELLRLDPNYRNPALWGGKLPFEPK
jgi:hypothetical protein